MKLKRSGYQRGSLRKVERSSGFAWELRYRVVEDGTRRMKQATLDGSEYRSEADARRKLDALLLTVNQQSTDECFEDIPLATLMGSFKETEMPERPKSKVNYLLLLNRHIQPRWGDARLSQVKPHAVEVWLSEMPYTPETRRHIRNMLYRLFEFAMRKGVMAIQRNPIELVRVKGSARTKELVVLTPDQLTEILSRLSDPYRLMVQLAAFLGLRICEVLGLQFGDIDHPKQLLHIRRSAVDGNVADTKTAASADALPLSAEMLSLLDEWREEVTATEEGWLFPSPVTEGPQHAGILLRRHIKPVAKAMGLPSLGWHSFRHSYRSWLDAVGTPVGVQQKMMRHADVATTMNLYGSALLESKRQAHRKVLEFAGFSHVGACGVQAVN
jgi:integrase